MKNNFHIQRKENGATKNNSSIKRRSYLRKLVTIPVFVTEMMVERAYIEKAFLVIERQ